MICFQSQKSNSKRESFGQQNWKLKLLKKFKKLSNKLVLVSRRFVNKYKRQFVSSLTSTTFYVTKFSLTGFKPMTSHLTISVVYLESTNDQNVNCENKIIKNNIFILRNYLIKKTHYKFNFHYNYKQVEDIYLQCELVQVKE